MFLGSLRKKINITGYLKNNLLEPLSLEKRHDDLVREMKKRNYNHASALQVTSDDLKDLRDEDKDVVIDKKDALMELMGRCAECRQRALLVREGEE
jgi:hypothetical protein